MESDSYRINSVHSAENSALQHYYKEIDDLRRLWNSLLRKQDDIKPSKLVSECLGDRSYSQDESEIRINDLKNAILIDNEYVHCQKQVETCLQLSAALPLYLKWGYEDSGEVLRNHVKQDHEVIIQSLIEKNSVAVENFVESLEELHQLEHTVEEKQKESLGLTYELRSLNKNLTSIKKPKGTPSSEENVTECRYHKFVHLFAVTCQTFQDLIMASQLDWRTDPKLKKLIVMLGKKVTF